MANVKTVDWEYTGGGVISFWGELDNGHWYATDTDGCISEYDVDTDEYMQKYLKDEDFDYYEYDNEHVLKRYHPTKDMLNTMIKLVDSTEARIYLEKVMSIFEGDYGTVFYDKEVDR